MRKTALLVWIFFLFFSLASGDDASFKKFSLETQALRLSRAAQPHRYFDSVGRKSSILGTENGKAEVWVYPYKVIHNFQLYFLAEDGSEIIEGQNIAERVDVYPHLTVIRYVHSSFRVEEIFFTPLNESGAVILLSVETVKPISVVASFTPDLKPMWPAGLGGQYSYWDDEKKYFVISEGTRKNVGLVGSPCGERFSSGPAHALPEGDMKIRIIVSPEEAKTRFYPFLISASHEGRKRADEVYSYLQGHLKQLFLEKFSHYQRLDKDYLSIQTPDETLNRAFAWAKIAVDKALVCNPQLGCGLVAGYGLSGRSERPGFAWYFGGDAFFNAMAFNSCGTFDITRQALAFIAKNQRQDGKIMHELSQGAAFIRWFEEYPYGFYHADTTPYYLVAMNDYLNSSGDLEFIKENWLSIERAYEYILSCDKDGDGLMENTAAGLAALELGAFLKNTKVDIYLAALSVEAHKAFSELLLLAGKNDISLEVKKRADRAREVLAEKFWVEEEKKYAHALTVEGKPLAETTVWPSMPLFLKQLPQQRADFVLDVFTSSEMTTDWGVRSLSPQSSSYDPLNYNYGTVWPFLTGYVCLSEYNYGRGHAAFSLLMSLANNTFVDALGFCPELFSGEFFKPIEEAVPHQIFSSSPVVTCLVRGLLGLKGDALKREVEFRPTLPGGWDKVRVKNFRLGKDSLDIEIQRTESKLELRIEPRAQSFYVFYFSPSLGYGAEVKSVSVNGEKKDFDLEEQGGEVRCRFELEVKGKTRVEITFEKNILLLLPRHVPEIGDKTSALKIIRTAYKDNELHLLVEGLAGKDYSLSLISSRALASVKEAKVEREDKLEKRIRISFQGDEGSYMKKEVVARFK